MQACSVGGGEGWFGGVARCCMLGGGGGDKLTLAQ